MSKVSGLQISELWREVARPDWKLERELSLYLSGKSVISALSGSKHGVALPDLILKDRVSVYILERLETALCSPT